MVPQEERKDMNSNQDSIIADKQSLQRRHYFILAKLQEMVKAIEKPYQQRFSAELLASLSNSLIDGTVFEIVRGLAEIQTITEKSLHSERMKVYSEYSTQKDALMKRHRDAELQCETRPHNLPIVQGANKRELDAYEKRMNDELRRIDLKIVNEIDLKVNEQQDTMKKAGVPGFQITNCPLDLKVQMYILEFIQRLGSISIPK